METDFTFDGRGTVKKGYEVVLAKESSVIEHSDKKMFNYLLQRSYKQLNSQSIHKIPVADVLAFLRHTSVQRVEESLRRLGSASIEIDYVDSDSVRHTVKTHFLSYDLSHTEDGMLFFAFDPILLQYLWEPKIFTTLNINFIRNFKSYYGSKLYEVMSLFEKRFSRTWTVSVEDLRRAFGVADDQYERFDNFRRAVIDKAVEEVNQLADFAIDVEYIRAGRGGKVVEVRFTVTSRPEAALMPSDVYIPNKKSKYRDPNTIDFLDGRTDLERGDVFALSPSTIEEARNIMIAQGLDPVLVQNHEEQWRNAVSGLKMNDPDLNFLRWLKLQIEKEKDSILLDLDDDTFGSLLENM